MSIDVVQAGSLVLPYAERALDPATWDLAYPAAILRGVDAIVQRLRVRLGFFLGEWFLDTSQGVPYRERVFVKNPRLPVITSMFRNIILDTPGIAAVLRCSVAPIDARSRSATLTFVARLSDGSIIKAVNEPFIVVPGVS